MRRRRPLQESVRALALELKRSEGQIALLDRVRPLNLSTEQARLTRAGETGLRPAPAFEYAPRAALSALRGRLSELADGLDATEAEPRLLAERARELELEAALAEHVGDAEFALLAARRFPLPQPSPPLQSVAEQFRQASSHELSGYGAEVLHVSDDARDPSSLWSQVSRLLAREDWAVRIERVPGLVSLAAVADGVVRIRPGARLTAAAGRRIALHEIDGHLRPRASGQRLGGAFVAGTVGASEDEEGRAILLEERAGLLDPERRRELSRRYLAAEAVRQGADFWQTVTVLGHAGASLGHAVELACRVHRGGGLARESIYLSGYVRVATGLAERPELERLLERGRISLDAARALLADSVELDDDRDVV